MEIGRKLATEEDGGLGFGVKLASNQGNYPDEQAVKHYTKTRALTQQFS